MKIALLGSAPSSAKLAPFDDPTWSIWGCSPGLYPVAKRVDSWFEMHRWEPGIAGKPESQVPWFSPEYVQWMGNLKCPVYMHEPVKEIPTSVAYPIEKVLDDHGPYFFNSSLSYMAALALDNPAVTEIGFWGVDMSATEEYMTQRLGCHYFITEAFKNGVIVHVPPESDLMQPRPLYGLGESSPYAVKHLARQRELQARLAGAQNTFEQAKQEVMFLNGAIDNIKYEVETWAGVELLERMARRRTRIKVPEYVVPAVDAAPAQVQAAVVPDAPKAAKRRRRLNGAAHAQAEGAD